MQGSHNRVVRRTALSAVMALVVAMLALLTFGAGPAQATHFRANQLTWHQVPGTNDVEFHISGAWRCTGFFANCLTSPPAANTTIPSPAPSTGLTTGVLDTGHNGLQTPSFKVVSVDVANDVVVGEAHFTYNYPGTQMGPWNVRFGECCRLSGPAHRNNPDGDMRVTSIVDLTQTSASPESSMTPVVDCKVNVKCQFSVPAFDPDGHQLRYRMATAAEAAQTTGFVQPGPPFATNSATIDPSSGLYSWNTAGVQLNPNPGGQTYYSTQVIVEELVGTTVVTKTAVDFFIRINNTPNAQPVFVAPTPADGTIINTTVGSNVSFDVQATDADTNDTVTPGIVNKPAAATFTPVAGNPATASFSWTPSSAGSVVMNLTAQDQNGLGAVQRSITINVANPSRNISVNDVTVNENAGTADFTVSLNSAPLGPISVDYATFDVSANQPGDYTKTDGTLTFAAGESTKTVSVPINDDNNPEGDETFELRLSNPVGGVITDGTGIGTITDTDRAISVDNVSVDESAGTATFTVTLASAAAAPLSVDYATADVSASQPGDYIKTFGTLNFVPTDLTKTVTVPIVNDNTPEGTETFRLELSNASGGVITTPFGTGTITDTDRTISVNSVTGPENGGSLTFTVSLDAAAVAPVTVDYATADGSASQPGDYAKTFGSLTFAAGDLTKSVTVPLTNDNQPEGTETFTLGLSNASGGVVSGGPGVGTITDSDREIRVNDVSVDESAGTATFMVSLDATTSSPVSLNYATADGSATSPGDYTSTSGPLVIASGQLSKTVTVPIVDDNTPEPTEKFELRLSNADGGVIVDGVGEGTITDADRRISINDVTVDESAGTATFKVTLDAAAVNPVTVNYATANGTTPPAAPQPSDYLSASGPLNFAPGQASKDVTITIVDDNQPEPSETFLVNLSGASGGVIDDGTGVGTITDQDRRISVNDVTVDESAGTAMFLVTLDAPAVNPVNVNFATANDSATAGSDYVAKSGPLTFSAGQTTKSVVVSIIDDVVPEPTEKFELRLSGATGGVIVDGTGVGTITDTDRSISVNDVTVNEGAGTATFQVSLNSPATAVVKVDYATANGSAVQPGDYTATGGTLTFAVGEQHKNVSVVIVNDTADEPAETFQLKLSNAVGGGIVDDTGVGTIIDNDRNGAFYCRATGIRYTSEAVVANAPGTPCADDTKSALTVPLGPITAALVNAKTDQTPNSLIGTQPVNGDSAAAHSDTATVNFLLGAVKLRVTAVVSDAKATCQNGQVVLTGSSSVAGLKLGNNLPYGVLRSYMKIAVPGILSLEVNKQTKVGGKLIQQALVITLLNGTPIVIGEAIAGANGNPCVV